MSKPCEKADGSVNGNVCVAEGCYGMACVKSYHPGVWVSYSYDIGPSDVRPHENEIAALRLINTQGYGSVIFVRFGEDVRAAEGREKEQRRVNTQTELATDTVVHGGMWQSDKTWCDHDVLTNPRILIAQNFQDITCESCKSEILRNI